MVDIPPPGRLAIELGANAIVTCNCDGNTFYPLAKLTPEHGDDQLVALKCTTCGKETVVPLDPKRDQPIKAFDRNLSDEMNRIRAAGREPGDEL